jgi:glutamate 5-kinase
MERYASLFKERGMVVGQVLLTKDLFANRAQYLHARNALERMLSLGVVPIVNENDAIVVDEIRLGDNDRLAAIVSHLVSAGILVLLTDTAGLYTGDPKLMVDVELLSAVHSGLEARPPRSRRRGWPHGRGFPLSSPTRGSKRWWHGRSAGRRSVPGSHLIR